MTLTKIQKSLIDPIADKSWEKKEYDGTGTQDTFAIGVTPLAKENISVFIDGLLIPFADWTLSGSNVVLNTSQKENSEGKKVVILNIEIGNVSVVDGITLNSESFIDSSITSSKISTNACTTEKFPDESCETSKIASNAFQSTNFEVSSIKNYHFAGSIGLTKFNNLALESIHNKKKNYIHNSKFEVQQRGFSSSIGAEKSPLFCDRWQASAGVKGQAKVTTKTNTETINDTTIKKYLHFQQLVAPISNPQISQFVENIDVFNGKNISFSFWAKASFNIDVDIIIQRSFSSGNIIKQTLSSKEILLGPWKRYVVNGLIDDLHSTTFSNGINATEVIIEIKEKNAFEISVANVQLEIGKESSFSFQSMRSSLDNSEFYFEKSYDRNKYPSPVLDTAGAVNINLNPYCSNQDLSFKIKSNKNSNTGKEKISIFNPATGKKNSIQLIGSSGNKNVDIRDTDIVKIGNRIFIKNVETSNYSESILHYFYDCEF